MKKLSLGVGSMLLALVASGCGTTVTPPSSAPAPVVKVEPTAPTDNMAPIKMEPQTPPEMTAMQKTQMAAGSAAHKPAAMTFDVNAGMFYFVPNVMHVKKGDTVTINLKDDGGFHDFTLDEFKVKIGPVKDVGEMKTATFTADKVGTFEYYCSVGKHREMGQKGTLIVE